jgi:hypothetical protein
MAEASVALDTEVKVDMSPGTTPEDLAQRGKGGESPMPQQLAELGVKLPQKESSSPSGFKATLTRLFGRKPEKPASARTVSESDEKEKMNRRDLLKRAGEVGVGVVAGGIAGTVAEGLLAPKEASPTSSTERGLAVEYAIVDSIAQGIDPKPKTEIEKSWGLAEPISSPDSDVQLAIGTRQGDSVTGLFVSSDNGQSSILVAEGVKAGGARFVGGSENAKQIAVVRPDNPYDPNSAYRLTVYQAGDGVQRTAEVALPHDMSLTDENGEPTYRIKQDDEEGRRLIMDQPPPAFVQGQEPKSVQPIVVPLGL